MYIQTYQYKQTIISYAKCGLNTQNVQFSFSRLRKTARKFLTTKI